MNATKNALTTVIVMAFWRMEKKMTQNPSTGFFLIHINNPNLVQVNQTVTNLGNSKEDVYFA